MSGAGQPFDWTEAAAAAEFQPRDSVAEMVFDGHLWLMGGWFDSYETPPRDVWKSADGRQWEIVTNRAPWKHADFPMGTVFQDRLWVMGGWYNGRLPNHAAGHEVWSSADGRHWDLATAHAGWSPRLAAGCVAFAGKLWILGGIEDYYFGDEASVQADVWNSSDGATWHCVTTAAPWGSRAYLKTLVFAGKIWVIGGGNYVPEYRVSNDVWSSPDGVHWTRVTAAAAWPARLWFSAAVYRDRLWVMGGWSRDAAEPPAGGGAKVYLRAPDGAFVESDWGDAWHSADGATWTRLATNRSWSPRHAAATFVFRDRLWIAGGHARPLVNDVWSLELPRDWPGP